MLHIAIVEDEERYAAELEEFVRRYGEETKRQIKVTQYQDGEDLVEDYKGGFDILLMDIQMQFMDGMTAAEKIRERDQEVQIIFITNRNDYAIRGYEVDALDYVLKPVTYFSFSQRIDRALARMKKRTKKYLSIPCRGGIQKLDVSLITYVEVQNHDLIFHTAEQDYLSKGSLTDLEQTLERHHFFRCNKWGNIP